MKLDSRQPFLMHINLRFPISTERHVSVNWKEKGPLNSFPVRRMLLQPMNLGSDLASTNHINTTLNETRFDLNQRKVGDLPRCLPSNMVTYLDYLVTCQGLGRIISPYFCLRVRSRSARNHTVLFLLGGWSLDRESQFFLD